MRWGKVDGELNLGHHAAGCIWRLVRDPVSKALPLLAAGMVSLHRLSHLALALFQAYKLHLSPLQPCNALIESLNMEGPLHARCDH